MAYDVDWRVESSDDVVSRELAGLGGIGAFVRVR